MAEHSTGYTPTQTYRRLLGYVYPHWRAFLFAFIGLVLAGSTEGAFVYFLQPLIDGTFVDRDPDVIKYAPLVLIGIFLVRGVATFLSSYWMAWVGRKVIRTLRSTMFDRLLCLPVGFYDATPSGTLVSKLIYDVEQVARATTDVITILIRDTITIFVLLGIMFYHNWTLALLMLVGTPFIAAIINFINKRFRRYSTRLQGSMGEVTRIAEEAIEGQRVVKTFGGQSYERDRFEETNDENFRLNMKLEITSAASVPLVQFIAAIAAAVVIHLALLEIERSELTVGTFISFMAAMMMLLQPMKRLTKITSNLQRGIAAAQSVFGFTDESPEVDGGKAAFEQCDGAISYRGVDFKYENSDRQILDSVEFTVEPGRSVAFVGRSGSGKSTLVSLLPRFYDVADGMIEIDGRDIRDFSLEELRDQIALVTQHITLFNDTIANNIAYGRLAGSSREAITAAAKAAHAMEFIDELPEGLDTMVGENGVLLSGGQRQRLAIARALLKDAPILILDEATSALDTESERHIQEALEELMRDRTTLVIAHRLSTIEKADQILVMERGRVIERGSHQQLLELDGHYATLHRMQFTEAG